MNLEGWHAWWRDRRQASSQNMLTYRVESGYVRHFYLPEHCMEGLHEVDKGETVRGLGWSGDLYPLGSSGRIFNSHSTIRSWFLRLHWWLCGKKFRDYWDHQKWQLTIGKALKVLRNRHLDSVEEGEGGMIWENSIETCILLYVKQITSPGSIHDIGCLGLVHWDDPEVWDGECGGRGVQYGENMHACGWFMSVYGKTTTIL